MSYSFDVLATSKDDAKAQVASQLDQVVKNQPVHAKDREVAANTANAVLDLITVPEGRTLNVTVSGSVGWNGVVQDENMDAVELTSAGVSVQASLGA